MTSSFLMCPPEYSGAVYEITPWETVKIELDRKQAIAQWNALYDLLTKTLRIQVELMNPERGLPNMVFTASGGIVRKRIFLRSSFRQKERRGEEYFFESWFRKSRFIVKNLPAPFCFEGEANVLFTGQDLWAGYHFPQDRDALELAGTLLKTKLFSLQMIDPRFYYLDSCFMPLDDQTALAYLPAFDRCSALVLKDSVPDLIHVLEEEALAGACNALIVGSSRAVILPEGCPVSSAELKKRHFEVYALKFSEWMKAGRCVKSLALALGNSFYTANAHLL